MRPYIAQIKSNLRLMARDRSVLFFSYLFPLSFFFLFAQSFHVSESSGAMTQVITMVLIIGVLGNGFFGAGMRAVQDRETNVLRRFKVAPVGPLPIIVAGIASGLVAFLPSVFLFFFFGKVIYRAPLPHNLISILIFLSIGVIAFRSLGMIIAGVVNSMQEMSIITQLLYLPMLFLSGATFPLSMMPVWLQKIAQFLPATYLFQGLQSLMLGGESFFSNIIPVIALVVTLGVALVLGTKLFRWEKEEKIAASAKLWLLAVLAPFVFMGVYQARTLQNVEKTKMLTRTLMRRGSTLVQNVKVFVGNGTVIEKGAVLVRDGKIAQVFGTPPSDPKALHAEIVDGSGKTLLPGLIDMHVHIGAPGGVYKEAAKYADPKLAKRRLAAYLYSGITAIRSTGDFLHSSLEWRELVRSGRYLGAELFVCGPLFTAAGGHPEELIANFPDQAKQQAKAEFLREPKSADEARQQVDALKKSGVDGIKAVLESGNAEWGLFNRLDTNIYDAVIAEAKKDNLPSATHTGNTTDMRDAITAGTNSIEHGSMELPVPPALFADMKAKQIAYDPTLSIYEGLLYLHNGNPELLNRSLLQQVGPGDLLEDTRAFLKKNKPEKPAAPFEHVWDNVRGNLKAAYASGVLLITGTDAGNLLVVHGPTVQHELELWVQDGIPPAIALQAATYNAAKVLRADDRIGLIQPGRDATFLLLDGDPLQDIGVTEHINSVYFKGEKIDRTSLFDQDKD
ncbi:MAG TPA: ABC transporter permease [Bryobacteraceae bacterium]|jgi:imidazolonepropionase-like amidohydrolase/ABC-type multidrug transport system permease subunit|nr:ABC transporter permease [Bryobacteraceae bacterium]